MLTGAVQAVRERMTELPGEYPSAARHLRHRRRWRMYRSTSRPRRPWSSRPCGVPVAKHGNRSASGNSGSAEVLAELGVAVEAESPIVARCLAELGITFLFAPRFHPALRHAAPVRRRLPFRTLFNLVGPLANPARPDFQLVGVPTPQLADLVAAALARLGVRRAAVVTGPEGLDEVILAGPTRVLQVEGWPRLDGDLDPGRFGLPDRPCRRPAGRRPRRQRGAAQGRLCRRAGAGPRRRPGQRGGRAARRRSRGGPAPEGRLEAEAIDSGAVARLLDRWVALSRSET